MPLFAALTALDQLLIVIGVSAACWLIAGVVVAEYGERRGFSFWPLLICSLTLGFPVVLLAVTIVAPVLTRQTEPSAGQRVL